MTITEDNQLLLAARDSVRRAEARLLALKHAVNALATSLGQEPLYPVVPAIRRDLFVGDKSPSDAVHRLFAVTGRVAGPMTVEEIAALLRAGGFSHKGDVVGLKISLAKDRLIRKLDNDTYGLASWWWDTDGPPRHSEEIDGAEEQEAPGPSGEDRPDDDRR